MRKTALATIALLGVTTGFAGMVGTVSAEGLPFANGQKNFIIAAGVTRKADTLTFAAVQSAANGFVVLYKIVDGVPQGDTYVGASYVPKGKSQNVAVKLNYIPVKGDHLVVMLHRDNNENKKFDFVFDAAGKVQDEVVKENTKMVARIFSAP
ncbi:MAG: hypothetical protein ABL973_03345 [Micropepsaceae bacterium]